MEVYTIQMARWRSLKETDITLIDTTVKSGYRFLAPTWDMVQGIKRGTLPEEDYTVQYLAGLDRSVLKAPDLWADLLTFPKIALACYCSSHTFCHRHILAKYLKDYAESCNVTIKLGGELFSPVKLLKKELTLTKE